MTSEREKANAGNVDVVLAKLAADGWFDVGNAGDLVAELTGENKLISRRLERERRIRH
jgi:hypothetical protein